ncbi:MAG: hypothetical protein CMJ64_01005 [Planctomycetaceae bacterium]|nr:hypothetical protein [Planctomycetaceae bacterium]
MNDEIVAGPRNIEASAKLPCQLGTHISLRIALETVAKLLEVLRLGRGKVQQIAAAAEHRDGAIGPL